MLVTLRTFLVIFATALLVSGSVVSSAVGQGVGFQPTIDIRSNVVSSYMVRPDRYSVAMFPSVFPRLDRRLEYKPSIIRSSYDLNQVTMNVKYRKGTTMVPIAVDATDVANLNFYEKLRSQIRNRGLITLQKTLSQRKRRGLSIGVALPKRFDRIFGEGGGNLKVSGYRRISFRGTSSWVDSDKTDRNQPSKFPSLNMEQISRFEITGTIGSKISVKVAQDSKQDIPLANRIQLRYKGDDDDVLRTIEAGNTNLRLPNTKFVGYSSRIQGLFGLKAEAQVGDFKLTAIASQEKGSSEKASITAGGEQSARIIRDYQYAEGRIFNLGYDGDFNPNDSIRVMFVYIQDTRDSLNSDSATLYTNPNTKVGSSETMRVKLLEQEKYERWDNAEKNQHLIIFNSTKRDAVGVYMEIERFDETGSIGYDTIGNVSDSKFSLKSLRATRNNYDPDHATWWLMWRNCYRINKGSSPEDLKIKILNGLVGRETSTSSLDYQEASNGSKTSYLTIVGLDVKNQKEEGIPDDLIDLDLWDFGPQWGLLILPDSTPFATNTVYDTKSGKTPQLQRKVPTIYDYRSPSERSSASQYFIQISTKTRSSTIRLGRANIIEGSERITANGQPLQKDIDYRIEYDFGTVNLISDQATDPNAEINIDFEYAPFLATQKKTLLGLRAQYDVSKDFKVGATFLYKSDKAQDRKPRVGMETTRAMVFDIDGSFRVSPQFLTTAIDALPLVQTEARSSISISGEIAHSRPNPNVNSQAYIDDFETSGDRTSIGMNRGAWTLGSAPEVETLRPATKYQRGKLLWHSMPGIPREEVYESESQVGEGPIYPFRLVFTPKPDVLQWDTLTQQTDSIAMAASWGSIMRDFSVFQLDANRLQLLRLRLRGEKGILHFDFGEIVEDVDSSGGDNTEDKDNNEAVSVEEDIGLDGKPNSDEISRSGQPYDEILNPDPSGDDWWFEGDWPPPVPKARYDNPAFRDSVENDTSPEHFEWINGTQGNRDDGYALGIPDQEKLGQGLIEENNVYFSFSVDLEETRFFVEDSRNVDGWRTYQIPITDSLNVDTIIAKLEGGGESSGPVWSKIDNIRVWFEADETETEVTSVEIAAWDLVQTNWQDTLLTMFPEDTTTKVFVTSVSDEENSSFTPPPGVEAYKDTRTNVTEAQRALSLEYRNLKPDDTGLTNKELTKVESYSGYRRLEMYVHGPDHAADIPIHFFFRIGKDSANYYEYFTTIDAPEWNERFYVNMDFNEITALKDAYLRNHKDVRALVDTASAPYRVLGRPNLNEIKFFEAGVTNTSSEPLSGQVWFDELRVTDVRKDAGTAVRLDLNVQLADLIKLNFGYQNKDPYFRGLSTATRGGSSNNLGSGSTDESMNAGVTLSFHKFLPRSWNAKIPISYSMSKSTLTPLLRNNSDIVLPEEIRIEERSTNETKRVSIRESFAKRGRNPLFTFFLNRQTINFSYTRSTRTSVNKPFTFSENYNFKASYDMTPPKEVTVPIFFWTKNIPYLKKAAESRLGILPKKLNWSATFNRSLSVNEDDDGSRRSSFRRDFDGKMNMSYNLFQNLAMTYNFTTKRDLTDPELFNLSFKNPKIGLETNYNQSFRGTYDPKLIGWFPAAFSYSANYSDSWERTSRSRNGTLSRTWTVSGSFKHIALLGGNASPYAGFPRGRSNVRGGKTKEKKKDKPFYDPPLAVLRFFTGWINPISYKYATSYKRLSPAMLERPSMAFRLGLEDKPDVLIGSNSRVPSATETESIDLSSGFKLLGGISTTVKYREGISRDLEKAGGATKYERISRSWPSLTISISKFSTLPFIKDQVNWFIGVFTPRTSYSRQVKEDYNLTQRFQTAFTETINRNPLIQLNFRLFTKMSLASSYGVTKTNSTRFGQTDGKPQSRTRSIKKTLSFTTKYSISAPGGISIPLFGKIRFKSEATVDLTVKYSSNDGEIIQPDGSFSKSVEKSDFSVRPTLSYSFSRQIRGGVSARWQDSNDVLKRRLNHTRELQFWVEIKF